MKSAPRRTELILTGRYAHPQIIKIADLVSEIKEKKHYYQKGIKARKGIEF
jgi:cob(I)alamin adenosyltransferase